MSFEEDIWFKETTPFTPAPELEQPEPELEETLSKKSGRPYKSGHTGAKCLYCLKIYKNAKPTDLEDHIANQCPKSNTQSATTTITASTSTSNKRRHAQSSRCTCALTRYFICCGIPFSTIEHPFCIDFIKSLCPGYNPPGCNFLSTTLINTELAYVQVAIEENLPNEKNLTLGLDGWTTPLGQSIYAFVIITNSKKEYIHSLMNLSKNVHTGEFIAQKIKEIT
ncbi:hypothetical protein Glove_543g117 [Diversispora epigaea]|uniref:DUF659 domain-containing protein n=1 Tax=Diversispora epigaea TaxID=1348612 RepID=A0A397GH34_9GLOM|nr:hypothetical protein Glove_543g117 [Diversispora epigaea]